MKTRFFFIFLAFLFYSSVSAQNREVAFEMNERLGQGINMGNAFEAPTETAWENPWKPEYFEIMAELGFDHVRIPIRWETEERSMNKPPYTIYDDFMERIKEVVDHALDNGLIAIINMHHHHSLLANPTDQYDRFLAQWEQIADYFKDYPDELLFEVLNEPYQEITTQLWNDMFADALNVIRDSNPTRIVVMGTAEFGGLSGVPHIKLPDDENLILSVHFYNPFHFTHQGASWVGEDSDEWLGTKWFDTKAERDAIINEFNTTLEFSKNNNIPVHVGEFGAYSAADLQSRVRWTNFVTRWFEKQDFSWAYWEFSAEFGIYDPDTEQLLEPLVDALLHNTMPDPTPSTLTTIHSSDFDSELDGWIFNTFEGTEGNAQAVDGTLKIEITNAGSEAWHIQLNKENISLIEGNLYQISFVCHASKPREATLSVGMNAEPWDAYSSHYNLNIDNEPDEYTFSFIMNAQSDEEARISFDMGTSSSNIFLRDIEFTLVEPDNSY